MAPHFASEQIYLFNFSRKPSQCICHLITELIIRHPRAVGVRPLNGICKPSGKSGMFSLKRRKIVHDITGIIQVKFPAVDLAVNVVYDKSYDSCSVFLQFHPLSTPFSAFVRHSFGACSGVSVAAQSDPRALRFGASFRTNVRYRYGSRPFSFAVSIKLNRIALL